MRRFLDTTQKVMPWLVLIYAAWGLISQRGHQVWGLPASYWHVCGAIVAVLVLVIDRVKE